MEIRGKEWMSGISVIIRDFSCESLLSDKVRNITEPAALRRNDEVVLIEQNESSRVDLESIEKSKLVDLM